MLTTDQMQLQERYKDVFNGAIKYLTTECWMVLWVMLHSKRRTWKRNAGLLVVSRFVGGFGDILFDYANNLWFTNLGPIGRMLLGQYQMAESIARTLFNVVAGTFVDRINRRKILIVADLAAAIACFVVIATYPTSLFAYALICANALLGIANSFYSPAYYSIIPLVVGKTQVTRVNSTLEITAQVLGVISPVISVFVLAYYHNIGALFVNAYSFLISAGLNAALVLLSENTNNDKDSNAHHSQEKRQDDYLKFKQIYRDFVEGVHFVVRHHELLLLLGMSSMVNFFLAGYNFLTPFAQQTFNAGNSAYASILVAASIGGIFGAGINGLKVMLNTRTKLFVFLVICGASLALIAPLYEFLGFFWPTLFCIAIFHAALSTYNIQFFSLVQSQVNEHYLGRVFSIVFTIAALLMPVGSLFFSSTMNVADVNGYLIIGGGVTAVTVLTISIQKCFLGNRGSDDQV